MGKPGTILSASNLALALRVHFPNASAEISDESYAAIKADSLGRLGSFLRRQLLLFRVTGWASYFDCDDFARLAHVLACVMHRKARSRDEAPEAEAPAFGQVHYLPARAETGHAINWALTDMGLICWEPQTQAVKKLTDSEMVAAWFVCA